MGTCRWTNAPYEPGVNMPARWLKWRKLRKRYTNVSMVEDFITGFRMGAQIMMAVLLPDSQSPEQIAKASQDE